VVALNSPISVFVLLVDQMLFAPARIVQNASSCAAPAAPLASSDSSNSLIGLVFAVR